MNFKLRVVFFGTPDFVLPILQILIDNFEVIGVVSAPDSIQGRKKELTPSPVKKFAIENDIPVLNLKDLKHSTNDQADLFVVAAYGKIISQEILDLPKNGAINIHPSLLPKYRGPSPIQSTLLNGDKATGISIIKMDEEMDHGPIVSQWEYPITNTDTFQSLHQTMFKDAAERLPKIIEGFVNGKISPMPQGKENVTYCKMITKETGYFESEDPPPPDVLDQMIRALYPWPTAWTRLQMANGELRIVKLLPEKMIQFEGGRPMRIKDAINGYPELKKQLERLLPQDL